MYICKYPFVVIRVFCKSFIRCIYKKSFFFFFFFFFCFFFFFFFFFFSCANMFFFPPTKFMVFWDDSLIILSFLSFSCIMLWFSNCMYYMNKNILELNWKCCVGTENCLKSRYEQFKSDNFSKILFLPIFCLIIVQNNDKSTILMIFEHFSPKKTKNLRFS